MIFSLYNKFGAMNSPSIWEAVKTGLEYLGHTVVHHNDSADVAVIWSQLWAGRMRSNQQVWQKFRGTNRPVLVIEVSAVRRGHSWRIMLNGNNEIPKMDNSAQRFATLGWELRPWTHSGECIVIACQRPDSQLWSLPVSTEAWLDKVVGDIRKHTDRPIVIRPHPRKRLGRVPQGCTLTPPLHITNTVDDFNFNQAINNAWGVINFNSSPGVNSVLAGVPVFVDPTSPAAQVGNHDFSLIETPKRPDREQWAWNLAHTEWTVSEIEQGIPPVFGNVSG